MCLPPAGKTRRHMQGLRCWGYGMRLSAFPSWESREAHATASAPVFTAGQFCPSSGGSEVPGASILFPAWVVNGGAGQVCCQWFGCSSESKQACLVLDAFAFAAWVMLGAVGAMGSGSGVAALLPLVVPRAKCLLTESSADIHFSTAQFASNAVMGSVVQHSPVQVWAVSTCNWKNQKYFHVYHASIPFLSSFVSLWTPALCSTAGTWDPEKWSVRP